MSGNGKLVKEGGSTQSELAMSQRFGILVCVFGIWVCVFGIWVGVCICVFGNWAMAIGQLVKGQRGAPPMSWP